MERGKKARVEILILGKKIQIKTAKRGKERCYIMIKGPIQDDITITNINTLNTGLHQYITQTLKPKKEKSTIIQ